MDESKPESGSVPPMIGPGHVWEAAWRGYVARAAGGDEQAMAALYEGTKSMVYGLALRMLINPADAEEVALDVYTQVWRSARSFDGQRGTVTAWLMLLTKSRAIDRLRARGNRERNTEPLPAAREFAAETQTPEQASALGEKRAIVLRALQRLPSEQGKLLELAYFSDLTHTELAAMLGEPLGTVKTRIRLGMIRLRELLRDSGIQPVEA
jgi:RNA polymerase sigma-70 factor (ECF subfamily)